MPSVALSKRRNVKDEDLTPDPCIKSLHAKKIDLSLVPQNVKDKDLSPPLRKYLFSSH
jgi:hypothetical protein